MKTKIKKYLVAVGIYFIRWAIRLLGPIWPKSQLDNAIDAFELLDKYYGHIVDPDDRIELLLNTRTEAEQLVIYQDIYDLIMVSERLKRVVG